MVINTNLSAQSAAALLMNSSSALATSLQRLSSGSKIVSPADDSAGAAEAMKLNAKLARINATTNNINDALSFAQTQDGYLQQVSTALTRMSELTIAAQDVTKTTSDLAGYDAEFHALGNFINDLGTKTFNGVSLFSGNTLQVTADSEGNTFALTGVNLNTGAVTWATNNHLYNIGAAHGAMVNVLQAIDQIAPDRASLGANIEALSYYGNTLQAERINLSAAKSQITDVDVAQESTNYARQNILVQSGTAMLAQANAMPNSVLKLLG